MAIKISNRARAIKPSATLAMATKAREMGAQGIEVINFGVGEPDFNTPEYIKEAAKEAIDANFTHYTAAAGILELRQVIAEKFKKDNNLTVEPQNILVSPGAKSSIINVLTAVCDPRDEVLIPSPFWVSYTAQVEMVDAIPIILPTEETNNFKISAKQLEKTLQNLNNPKALILNSPNNPTGAVYNREELKEIGEVCVKHNILIISDEIYEKLVYDGTEHISIASLDEKIAQITVVINGVSKAYAMTGWRLGYAAGPAEIIKRAVRIQAHTTSCVNSITQKAVVTALSENDGSLEKMRAEFEKRRNFLVKELNNIDHIRCNTPHGAFYALPNVSFYIKNNRKGITNSVELCSYLLENHHIAIVPGAAFGVDNYVRFSYANSLENIEEGLRRFKKGLAGCI